MKRYSYKSEIKKIKIKRKTGGETLYAEILRKPKKNLSPQKYEQLLLEISEVAEKGWGKFEIEYLRKNVMDTLFLCLLRNEKDVLIGIAPVKSLKILGKTVYSFGLSVIIPKYRSLKLLKKMFEIMVKKILIKNITKGKMSIEFFFITPNIKTLGNLARLAKFMYPNPYLIEKNGKIYPADDQTWELAKEYLRVEGEQPRCFEREGCVMEGFYDKRPHLIQEYVHHRNKVLNKFGETYLYSKPGREVVARVVLSLRSLIKNELGIF